MRAGFIGAGKVGFTLGKYLAMHGIEISGYYSRTPASAKEAAEFTQSRYYTSIEEITKDSDTLFLTVPDGAIGEFRQFLFHIRFPHSFFPVPYTHDLKIKIFVIAAVRFHRPFFLMQKTEEPIGIRFIPCMQSAAKQPPIWIWGRRALPSKEVTHILRS